MPVQSIGDYYTLQGAADELGVSYWQLWHAVYHQQIPTVMLGQTLLVMLEDVQLAMRLPKAEQADKTDNPQRWWIEARSLVGSNQK